jgi:hypothetical protein
MNSRIVATAIAGSFVVAGCAGLEGAPSSPGAVRSTAVLNNFITDDPLRGDNGLPPSPGAPLSYGAVNLGIDVDGDVIEAVDEQDLRYFDGHYYLYGPSFTCGSFNYAPGVITMPLTVTNPPSFYRYCGLTIYRSADLMNWKLVKREHLQDPDTGKIWPIKKPRVAYSPKTGLYTMWFLNGQGSPKEEGIYKITQSRTPVGPWGPVRSPSSATDPTLANLGPDFEFNDGPDGSTWMVTSHGGINLFRLNDEKTGTLEEVHVPIPGVTLPDIIAGRGKNTLAGGIGISHRQGWWYITGSNTCGNCIAGRFYYLMARDPRGPWLSPETLKADNPVKPALLSEDTGKGQVHGVVTLPDGRGGTQALVPVTHYLSSPTGAPSTDPSQPGDNNLSLSGHFYYPLTYAPDGRIEPMKVMPSHTFPLARAVPAVVPATYQANLGITRERAVVQAWDVKAGEVLASVMPSVFQRTPDMSPRRAAVIQDPLVNAPLLAKLEMPDGRTHEWTIDARIVRWGPSRVPLDLPEEFKGPGRVTLTLSTMATNGGYGVAVGGGPGRLPGSEYAAVRGGARSVVPGAELLLATSAQRTATPRIVSQPRSVRVRAGSTIGLLVEAQGLGLGYQWYRDGRIVLAPDGLNESTTAGLRLQNVTAADAGTYTVEVMNPVGRVTSIPVTLDVMP